MLRPSRPGRPREEPLEQTTRSTRCPADRGRRRAGGEHGEALTRAGRNALLAVVAAAVMAAAAQVSLPVPPGPVPVTLQSLAVLLAGAVLGARPAGMAVIIYVAAGAAGLPVFAGGEGGVERLSGATGGYLIGFLPAAWLAGQLAERASDRSYRAALLALLAGHAVIFLFGVSWLSRFSGGWNAVRTGLVPFLPGTALKCLAGAAVLALWRRRPIY